MHTQSVVEFLVHDTTMLAAQDCCDSNRVTVLSFFTNHGIFGIDKVTLDLFSRNPGPSITLTDI